MRKGVLFLKIDDIAFPSVNTRDYTVTFPFNSLVFEFVCVSAFSSRYKVDWKVVFHPGRVEWEGRVGDERAGVGDLSMRQLFSLEEDRICKYWPKF